LKETLLSAQYLKANTLGDKAYAKNAEKWSFQRHLVEILASFLYFAQV